MGGHAPGATPLDPPMMTGDIPLVERSASGGSASKRVCIRVGLPRGLGGVKLGTLGILVVCKIISHNHGIFHLIFYVSLMVT